MGTNNNYLLQWKVVPQFILIDLSKKQKRKTKTKNKKQKQKQKTKTFYFQNKIRTYTQCLSSACRLKKGTPRSENFRRNTPIIAKIPPKDPITKKQVKSKELRHPCGPSLQGFHSKRVQARCQRWVGVNGMRLELQRLEKFLSWLSLAGVVNVASLFRVKGRLADICSCWLCSSSSTLTKPKPSIVRPSTASTFFEADIFGLMTRFGEIS